MNNITLYDLMSQDLEIWVSANKKFGFNIQVDDENGNNLVDEKGIHPFAVESFADFCRSYLASYDKVVAKVEAA